MCSGQLLGMPPKEFLLVPTGAKERQEIFAIKGICCLFARSEKKTLAHPDLQLVTIQHLLGSATLPNR
jgi:hypothetical protein